MADRKITQLDLADSTDISSSNAVLHLVNPDRALNVDKNRKLELKNNVVLTSQDQTIDGTKTFSGLVVPDGGTIGSTTSPDAITIASNGDVSLSDDLTIDTGRILNLDGTMDMKGLRVLDASSTNNEIYIGAFSDIIFQGITPMQYQKLGVNYPVWTGENDGPGSGLDADTVDGSHASAFASSDSDSEQTLGINTAYFNDGSNRMNMDPRWNGDSTGTNTGNLHIWATNADGSTYGEAGIALYNGDDLQYHYLHTRGGHWTRLKNANGYIDFGPANTSWAHIYTDRPGVYFDKQVNAAELRSRGTATVEGDLYGRSVNAQYSRLYRWGGIYFTWDSDSYGTNFNHSITSTDNGAWSDDITINSYGRVRINIDSNGNGDDTFSIGRHTTGTGNDLFILTESGSATFTGPLYIPEYIYHSGDTDTRVRFSTNTISFMSGGNGAFSVYPGYIWQFSNFTSDGSNIYRWYTNVGSINDVQAAVYGDGDFRNDTGVFAAFSDERLKQDITDANSQWEDMKKLRFVNYRLKKKVAFMGDDAPFHLGVISQEVEAAGMGGLVKTSLPLPEDEDQTEYKMFKYSIMHTKAAKALQEAIFRIEALEAEVAALKA